MRKSSSFKEKLYINERALCIVGDKIKLVKQQRPQKCYTSKNLKISEEVKEEAPSNNTNKKRTETDKRREFKLNVKEYKNLQVCNRQLRQIYETVEVKDFERILRNLYVSDERKRQTKSRADVIIARIKPDEIYEQFHGQYYSYLKSIISKS